MVSSLDRKLVRDLLGMKGQMAAIILVMTCGVATFVMQQSVVRSLQEAMDQYYERYRFAEVFAGVKRAPNSLAERVAEIPGVAAVQARVTIDVTLDVPGLREPATGRLISVPDRRAPMLNDLHLRRGRYIEPTGRGEVIVGEAFAEKHGIEPGRQIAAVINGRWQKLTVVGVALSPEYIYAIRPGELIPDDKRFGIFWMGRTELEAAYNMQGAFNDLALTLTPGASEPEVIRRLDRLTEPYGGLGAHGRREQTSHTYVSDEIRQQRATAIVAPSIFLSVSALLLNVVLGRLIRTQREQIAALKALGYSKWEIGSHYLKMVLAVASVGCLLGTLIGARLAQEILKLYAEFFRFPVFALKMDVDIVALAILVTAGASVAGTFGSVRSAMRLPPAEAMRPEPPAAYRPTVLERMGLQWLFSPAVRMILRQLERNPWRTFFSAVGIALATSILVMGSFIQDAVDFLIEFQFFVANRQEVTVSFIEPVPARALSSVRHLPGVIYAEPYRAVPVRLRAGSRERRLGIMGIEPNPELARLLDEGGREVPLPPEGLLVSEALAQLLDVRVGDELTVEVMEGERPTRRVPLAGTIADFSGLSAYMDRRALHRLMREEDRISGAYLEVDPARQDELYNLLKGTPRVAGVTVQMAALESFKDTIAKSLLISRAVNTAFAVIIAFGVVYNCARIALSERSRELATLRVIGFTRGEISMILLGEMAVLTLAAIPPGLVAGYGFCWLMVTGLATETQRMPLVVYPSTFGFATVVVLIAATVSGLIVRRRLDRLDLVAVLKTKE
jgi:putative ABC transport system permease protein